MATVRVTAYGRVKPCPPHAVSQDIKIETGPKDSKVIFTNQNLKQESFRFKKIFDENSTQVEIFEIVGKPLIENTLKGYNSTILSYGQTGTGKTYTMTGEFHDPEYQGLIPRTIEEIFKNMKPSTEITISYFEIYNEHVFDLIKNDDQTYFEISETGPLSNTQSLAFRNLSRYKVNTVDQAMALLIQGESKKMLAQTSSNERSSRSHTIFAIGLKFPNSNGTYMNPVLLLVDLAGSENLSKCKGNHNFFETRYINLSLHYLEQVLLALRRPKRIHVPYRNSLMTTFLRNSLGGSCITAVIATFSISEEDIQETRQTCRFAVNVAYIKNELKVNEDLNCTKKLEDLEREVELLRAQLHMVTKDEPSMVLTMEDKEACIKEVQKFIREGLSICLPLKDPKKVQFCFHLLRKKILKMTGPEMEGKENLNHHGDVTQSKSNCRSQPFLSAMELPVEKNWRNQKQPMDLPKVNIQYATIGNLKVSDKLKGTSKKQSNFKITESESILLEAAKGSRTQPRIPVKAMITNFEAVDSKESLEIDRNVLEKTEVAGYCSAVESFTSERINSMAMTQDSKNSMKDSTSSGKSSLEEERHSSASISFGKTSMEELVKHSSSEGKCNKETASLEGSVKEASVGSDKELSADGSEKEESAEDSDKAESVEGSEKAESIEGSEKAESIEGSEKAESNEGSEKAESNEGSEKAESIEGSEKAESVEGSEKAESGDDSDKDKLSIADSDQDDDTDEEVSSDDSDLDSEEEIDVDAGSADLSNVCKVESNESTVSGLPLTGDQDVDEEIIKFYKSRYEHFKDS